ncbi:hypothetical protein H4R35_007549 [Dimargaris xerosporica]|nr:hypothetical protein H4R35_007549 [Dimargaris xerosporica]
MDTTEFTKMRRTSKKSLRINTGSLVAVLRPWQPQETHYYRRTAVPIVTWRVGIFLPRGQINLPNAKITRLSYLVRQAVRETFPGQAATRHDYLVIARPHIIDVSYDTLVQDLVRVALESQRLHHSARTKPFSPPPPTKQRSRKGPKSHV